MLQPSTPRINTVQSYHITIDAVSAAVLVAADAITAATSLGAIVTDNATVTDAVGVTAGVNIGHTAAVTTVPVVEVTLSSGNSRNSLLYSLPGSVSHILSWDSPACATLTPRAGQHIIMGTAPVTAAPSPADPPSDARGAQA